MTRRRKTVLLLLAATIVAAGATTYVWDLHHRAGLPPLVRERMPAYCRTVFIGDADARDAVRGLYGHDRASAAGAIKGMGPRAESAIPWLVAALADGSPGLPGFPNWMLDPDGNQPHRRPVGNPPAPPSSVSEQVMAWLFPAVADKPYETCASDDAADALVDIGPAAVEPLAAALKDPLPLVRLQALRSLANLADPRAVDPLIEVFRSDRSESVRRAAILALGNFDDPRATDALAGILTATPPDRPFQLSAAFALAYSNDAGRQVLVRMLREGAAEERSLAAAGFAGVWRALDLNPADTAWDHPQKGPPPSDDVFQALAAASRAKDDTTASYALEALRHRTDARNLPVLIEALRHESPDVRLRAINGLAELGGRRAVGPILEEMTRDQKDRQFCRKSADALIRIGDPAAAGGLTALLRTGSPYARVAAAQALGELRATDAADALAGQLSSGDRDLCTAASIALVKLGDRRGLNDWFFAHFAKDENAQSVYFPAFGEHLGPDAVATLAERAGKYGDATRILSGMHDPAAVDALIAIATDRDNPLSRIAVKALGGIRAKKVADVLAVLLSDPSASDLAITALARQQDERALAPLVADLSSPDNQVVTQALANLRELKDRRAIEPILALMQQRRLRGGPGGKTFTGGTADDDIFIGGDAIAAVLATGDPRGLDLYLEAYDLGWARDWMCHDPSAYLKDAGPAAFDAMAESFRTGRHNIPVVFAAAVMLILDATRALPIIEERFPHLAAGKRWGLVGYLDGTQDDGVTGVLCRILAADPDRQVRLAALDYIQDREEPQVVEALRRAAASDSSRQVRILAVQALEQQTGERRPPGIPSRWFSADWFGWL